MKKIVYSLALLSSFAFANTATSPAKNAPANQEVAMAKAPTLAEQKASQPTTQEEINIQNKASTPQPVVYTRSIDDDFDDFKDKMGFEDYGVTFGNGVTFYNESSVVNVQANDPMFAQHLSLAYEKAFLDLQAEIVISKAGQLAANMLKDVFMDNSSDRNKFAPKDFPGTLEQLGNKLSLLTGAALDKALAKLGVSPKDSQGLKEEEKKKIASDIFAKKIGEDAFGDVSGIIAVQTFVETTKRGSVNIGVIAVQSDKTRRLAKDIADGIKPSIPKGKHGKNLKEFLPTKVEDFGAQFGTRLVYDENGEPAILSYGNWGYPIDNSSGIILDKRAKYAKKSARLQADANIVAFVNTQIDTKAKADIGTDITAYVKRVTDRSTGSSQDSKQEVTTLKDKLTAHIKASAGGRQKGITTLKRWEYTDKQGRAHVGVVRVWSFKNVLNIDRMTAPLPSRSAGDTQENKSKKPTKFRQSSKPVNEVDDF